MAEDIRLTVGGKIWTGWESVTIRTGVEFLAGAFSLNVGSQWQGMMGTDQLCALSLGERPLVNGYLDKLHSVNDTDQQSRQLQGWDRAADLSACTVEPAQFRNSNLLAIINAIGQPFGVTATSQLPLQPVRRFDLFPGETGSEALDRLGRTCAVLIFSNGLGQLQVTRGRSAVRSQTALVEGENIVSSELRVDRTQRFSHYQALGQLAGMSDELAPAQRFAIAGEARDRQIKRHRPFTLLSESSVDNAQCQRRAQWQAAVAAARGWRLLVRVKGWTGIKGELWRPWVNVPVRSGWHGIDETLLVIGCTYTGSRSARFTDLELVRADAYELQPDRSD
ncbi:phage baseplate assembly protein [Endozoicomonas sp. ALB115]|uniref:phage baseplate assembly protein n=1 Tax=Endozoicomonas sp. ALB115 TaxID=3403074 RepID=UPI003BB80E0C